MKAPRPLERQIQRDVVAYLRRNGIFVIAIPNGSVLAGDGKARAIQSNALKKAGMTPGVADLLLIKPTDSGAQVAFWECKREGEKLRPEQEAFQELCAGWKLPFAVVRSVADARETLEKWNWL